MSDPRGDPLARRAAELVRAEPVDERAVERVLSALRDETKHNGKPSGELIEPTPSAGEAVVAPRRRFSLSIGPALAAGLVIFALGLGAGVFLLSPRSQQSVRAATGNAPESQAKPVEFVLVAPRAAHVALVGEFNGWDASATPMRHTDRGDGTWAVSVPLGAGRHVYAFVIDDSTWVPDPQAPLAPERWYGERNSVVVVPGGPRS
jgi:predicted carbohydrate-binding protein with CBM48